MSYTGIFWVLLTGHASRHHGIADETRQHQECSGHTFSGATRMASRMATPSVPFPDGLIGRCTFSLNKPDSAKSLPQRAASQLATRTGGHVALPI
jgi:hypothetical protein